MRDPASEAKTECEMEENEEPRELTLQEIRARNIAEMRAKYLEIFGKPMPQGGHCPVPKPKPQVPKKPRQPRKKPEMNPQPTRRSQRISLKHDINYNEDEELDDTDELRGLRHLIIFDPVYISYGNKFNADQPEEDDDDFRGFADHEMLKYIRPSRQVGSTSRDVPTLNPEDVTEEMLANICQSSGRKSYDRLRGTTCHQCRQKTLDTKTVCRSGRCVGVRGMFCGPCLKNRYGENVEDALKDKHWACPPCRLLCNCSICRTRDGQPPTGILAPYVAEKGYKSVKDYLKKVEDEELED